MLKALIIGATGQDGMHLTKFLLKLNYNIVATTTDLKGVRANHYREVYSQPKLVQANLLDFRELETIILSFQPDEIYNLSGPSHVGASFSNSEIVAKTIGIGTLKILEVIQKNKDLDTKFYQASSSEMFGNALESPQNENTLLRPNNPYAHAKTFAHQLVHNYRNEFSVFACSGILFNHESEYRGIEFVTRKITSNLARIKLGQSARFSLGSLSPTRDWGYAGDYVEAMWMMLQQPVPADYVIATGQSHSVGEFLLQAMKLLDLGDDISKYVDFSESLIRPTEIQATIGDATKARKTLGWRPKTNFDEMISIMVKHDLHYAKTH
jgi:GDPmannose 4,6-dehydratase